MKYLPLLWLPMMILGSCSFFTNTVDGNGNLVVRHVYVGEISSIEHAAIGRIIVTQGESSPITMIAEENILDYLAVRQSGDTLVVENDQWVSLNPTVEPIFLVTLPALDRLHLTGAGDIIGDGILSFPRISLILEGAGRIEASLDTTETVAVLSGSGIIELTGLTSTADLSLAGQGTILADRLESDTCEAMLLGSGDIHVLVKEYLNAVIYGVGDIVFKGPALVNAHVHGVGSVRTP